MTNLEDILTAPLAENELVGVRELLVGQGFSPKVIGAGLQCEQTLLGQRVGLFHFYPAERLLSALDPQNLGSVPRSSDYSLRLLWGDLFVEEHSKEERVDQYLYAVAPDSVLATLQTSGLLAKVESDMSYARKTVCELQALPGLLSQPFEAVAPAWQANAQPTLHLLRELYDDPEVVAKVTHWLTLSGSPWSDHRLSVAQQERMGLVYGRIMGRGFSLKWDGDEVAMVNNGAEVPPQFASRGEQAGFAFAHFLTMAYEHLAPGMTLGIRALISSLDTLKQLALLEVLRNLVAATGVSLVIQTAKTDTLRLAKKKFKHIAEAEIR